MSLPKQQTAIDYEEALQRLHAVAAAHRNHLRDSHRAQTGRPDEAEANVFDRVGQAGSIPLAGEIGKICTTPITAPFDIPGSDTSAMDGYAICTSLTKDASPLKPVRFQVVGSLVAGEYQRSVKTWHESVEDGLPLCFEIMTGASFPVEYPFLDGVVKIEDVHHDGSIAGWQDKGRAYCIAVTGPIKPQQHRRPAGSDYRKGETVVNAGERIEMRHVMALAAIGFTSVAGYSRPDKSHDRCCAQYLDRTQSKLNVGVLSTGSEVTDPRGQLQYSSAMNPQVKGLLFDSNGPYLCNQLSQCARIEVSYLGVVGDRTAELVQQVQNAATRAASTDVLILTGGVSKGRCDLTRASIEEKLGGKIEFHGVKIRPGAPILLSTVNVMPQEHQTEQRSMTVFGLPGNPMAVAAGFRFFVRPFLDFCFNEGNCGHGIAGNPPAIVRDTLKVRSLRVKTHEGHLRTKPRGTVAFWLAWRDEKIELGLDAVAEICADQASYKTSVLTRSNCWVIVPAGLEGVVSGMRLPTVGL